MWLIIENVYMYFAFFMILSVLKAIQKVVIKSESMWSIVDFDIRGSFYGLGLRGDFLSFTMY